MGSLLSSPSWRHRMFAPDFPPGAQRVGSPLVSRGRGYVQISPIGEGGSHLPSFIFKPIASPVSPHAARGPKGGPCPPIPSDRTPSRRCSFHPTHSITPPAGQQSPRPAGPCPRPGWRSLPPTRRLFPMPRPRPRPRPQAGLFLRLMTPPPGRRGHPRPF